MTPEETEADSSAVVQRRVRGHGVDLAVTELGDRVRPTVVLIHGFPNTSAVWAPVAQLLATGGFHVASPTTSAARATQAFRPGNRTMPCRC